MRNQDEMSTRNIYEKIMGSSLMRLDGPEIDLTDEIILLCKAVMAEDDTDWDMDVGCEFALGDLIVGAFWAYSEWHAGQHSREYQALSLLGQIFKPGCASGPEPESSELCAYEMVNEYFEDLTNEKIDTAPEALRHYSLDEVAETVPGLTPETYAELWNALAQAEQEGNAKPLGGDGSDGTTEEPIVSSGEYSTDLVAGWSKLSEAARENIHEAATKL